MSENTEEAIVKKVAKKKSKKGKKKRVKKVAKRDPNKKKVAKKKSKKGKKRAAKKTSSTRASAEYSGKRIKVSIAKENYEEIKAFAAQRGLDVKEAIDKICFTGITRQRALDKYAGR